MADEPSQPQSPTSRRRSSFAGQTFADLFGGRPSMNRGSTDTRGSAENSPPASMPGPISQAAAQAQQRRRMSLTTLGLGGSTTGPTSPFGSFRGRQDSIGSASANSGSIDESAIAEDSNSTAPSSGSPPNTPFARRMSFGAKAMRDIRTGSFGGGGAGGGSPGSPGQNGTRSPPAASNKAQNGTISSRAAKGRGLFSCTANLHPLQFSHITIRADISSPLSGPSGEGFNWSDNLRNRAERTSIAGIGGVGGGSPHNRAKSVATMEPPPPAQMPKPKERPRPDHFQERILKGDFYMD